MMIHRLVIIDRLSDGQHLGASEDTAAIDHAIHGLDDWTAVRDLLVAAKPVRRELIAAGIRIRITLTPSHARNRTAIKQDSKPAMDRHNAGVTP